MFWKVQCMIKIPQSVIDDCRQVQNLLYVPLYYQNNLSSVILAASSDIHISVLAASAVSWQPPKIISAKLVH